MHVKTKNKLIAPEMEFCFHKLKPLSREFSRQFGYSEKDGETIFRYLNGVCLGNTSISDYCKDHKAFSADTILKLGKVPLEEMVRKCNKLLAVAAGLALSTGRYRGCDTSFDYHDMPFCGKRREWTIKTVVKGKVRRCYRYAVASLTGNKRFLALSAQPYKEGCTNMAMVDQLLDSSPNGFDTVLMDRYFVGVDVFNTVEGRDKHFLTPYKINDVTDELYKQSLLDGETVKRYHMRRKGGKWKTVFLHLVPHPVDEYHAYVSDLSGIKVKEHYPARWNIENLFKTKNGVKADTSSTRESWRFLLFTIELILSSLWKLLVRIKEHVTVKRYKKQLYTFLEEHTLLEDIEDETIDND